MHFTFHNLFLLNGTRITLQCSAFQLRAPLHYVLLLMSIRLCVHQVKSQRLQCRAWSAFPRLQLLNGWVMSNVSCTTGPQGFALQARSLVLAGCCLVHLCWDRHLPGSTFPGSWWCWSYNVQCPQCCSPEASRQTQSQGLLTSAHSPWLSEDNALLSTLTPRGRRKGLRKWRGYECFLLLEWGVAVFFIFY